jgi:diamine N-acetyltransferase
MRHLIDINPVTLEQETARYDEQSAGGSVQRFTLYDRATLRPIGIAALNDIDDFNGCAEYSIVIGEGAFRGRGYGTEATRLMLDYAFTALGLRNVMLRVFESNPAAIRAYEKAGLRRIGQRREAQWVGGRRWDVVYMDCLAEEFESPVLARVFVPDTPR